MRVLEVYACYYPNVGGVEVHIHDLCECLKTRGHQVSVLTYAQNGPSFETIDEIGVRRIKIPNLLLLPRYVGIIVLAFLIEYFATKMKIDVVHVHGYMPAMSGGLVEKISRRPVVATFHLPPKYTDRPLLFFEWFERRVRARWLSYLSTIIGVSKYTLLELSKIGVETDNMRLIWNWVPSSIVQSEKDKDKSGEQISLKNIPNKTINIISVGRLSPHKGFDILIAAIYYLTKSGFNLHAKIVGDGPEKFNLAKMCVDYGLESRIEFTGRISEKEKISLVKSSDIFVVSSRYEGLPLTVLEAMYLGTPVVATNVSGVPEIISEGCNMVLTEPNVESLLAALKSVIINPVLGVKMAKRARKTVDEKFSLQNCAETVSHLESLIHAN